MKGLQGRNDVKVYNLSPDPSLPGWVSHREGRKILKKRHEEKRNNVELIMDFRMPDVSNCIKVSSDGQYIVATGTYKPIMKCFEVSALSQKFERGLDMEVLQFDILSDDYSKLVFLQSDRYVELHNQGGRWFRTRIPKASRDLAYHHPSCDLYFAASGSSIYRLNLHEGRFMTSIQSLSEGVNKCVFNKVHYLFTCGTEDGRVEAWDPRCRKRVGLLDCAMHMLDLNIHQSDIFSLKEMGITSLAYNDTLTLGVGTHTGQVILYDIRSDKPYLIKDHMDGFPIKDLEFHPSTNMVFSMASNTVKIWNKENGKPHTSIDSTVQLNDLCLIPDSGMMFLANESPRMNIYFLPSIGTAPRWCSHLDALIEELEEESTPQVYDDYKFVTTDELSQLGMDNLIGSDVLRAVMHGYYMDVRLYNKAKATAKAFLYDEFQKNVVKNKIKQSNKKTFSITQTSIDTNKDLHNQLVTNMEEGTRKQVKAATSILSDQRFKELFENSDFYIDKASKEFTKIRPAFSKKSIMKEKLKEEGKMLKYMNAESSESDSEKEEENSEMDSKEEEEGMVEKQDGDNSDEEEEEEEEKLKEINKEKTGLSMQKLHLKSGKSHINESQSNSEALTHVSDFVSVDSPLELRQDDQKTKNLSLTSRLQEVDECDIGAFSWQKEKTFRVKERREETGVSQENAESREYARNRKRKLKLHHLERKREMRCANHIKPKRKY